MNAEKIFGETVYVNLDEVIETVYQCRRDVADDEWVKRWLIPLKSLPTIEVSEDAISREYLEEQYRQTLIPHEKINTYVDFATNIGIEIMHSVIEDAPSVAPTVEQSSMVDIVRCKDCRWYKDFDGCFFSTAEGEPEHFCSWGERKEE